MKTDLIFPKITGVSLLLLVGITALLSCTGTKPLTDITAEEKEAFATTVADTVEIVDAESEYEIIIIDPGFNVWLRTIARPPGYYSQTFLENRNQVLVVAWNNRVLNTLQYDPLLYQMRIDYEPQIDYGYDVNYKLYNYFIFFQRKYNQRLGPFLPRI